MNVRAEWTEPQAVRLTDRDFLYLADSGALDAYPKTELIDGIIFAVSPQHSTHGRVQGRFYRALADAVDALDMGLEAWTETSIRLNHDQVPQADIVVTSYAGPRAMLTPDTVPLVVEIADTSAKHDRTVKARIYAQGGIPEYWVVDVQAGEIVQFCDPNEAGYQIQRSVVLAGVLTALTIADLRVDTGRLAGIG